MIEHWQHPTNTYPNSVVILGLGESKRDYDNFLATSHNYPFPEPTEIWTVNAGFRIWRHDLLFVMDDLEGEAYKWPSYGDDLERHDKPIITSRNYPRWCSHEYPFHRVCETLGIRGRSRYFPNSIPFMLAYAYAIDVQNIWLFGVDYWHDGQLGREAGQASCEWWLGFGIGRGVHINLGLSTTLMNANRPQETYGYRYEPTLAPVLPHSSQATEADCEGLMGVAVDKRADELP